MPKDGMKLEFSDKALRNHIRNMDSWSAKTLAQVNDQIKKVTFNVAADAQQNVKDNGSVATSNLINSISTRFKDSKLGTVGIVKVNAIYGAAVEFGRKAGGMPPIAPILTWIRKKGLATTTHKTSKGKTVTDKRDANQADEERSMAFAIAKSIAKNGTQARPFLIPAFKKGAKDLEQRLIRVLKNSGKNSKV